MKSILEIMADELRPLFSARGYDEKFAMVKVSNRPDLCEYQCNGAMAAAKQYRKKPIDIATEVAEAARDCSMFSEVNAVMPGFINIRISNEWLAEHMEAMAQQEKLGLNEESEPKTVVIDFGGANAAKPLHVGHLRSAVIGESIQRMARYMGNHVISDVHLGDWGLQMGLIITELQERKPELPYFDPDFSGDYPAEAPFTIAELEEIYPAASKKSKVDEAFAEKAHQATLRLQEGYAPYTAIWNHIMNVSKKDLKRNYDNLDVHFDLWKGESDAEPYIPGLIDDLVKKGLAVESQGALVVDIAEESDTREYPPCIVRKSDGAALYATSDLATIIQREQDFHPDRYIYVVDKRQELHFTQVFRVSRKAGYVKPETELTFLGFGTMNGKDGGPFKTRDGGVMRLEYLIHDINEEVEKKIREKGRVPENEIAETVRRVGLAALKYGDLSNQATKDYIFDVDRFTSFEGNTGPHIQYMDVRIKSILSRYAEEKGADAAQAAVIRPAESDSEKKLQMVLAKFGEAVEGAWLEIAPHKICAYMSEVSDAFSAFYLDNNILGETDENRQKGFIALIRLTSRVLETCMDLIGVKAPDHM
ncbi:arginine--tRNA ligase [[Clostridium] aminophilum]|uniref:Arginine--tRNA ligase n=1 Tax=[Clostridium] aminophilum TaxID=1526 RepID=A0A1I6JLE0_9FIRM|nr:arginine--tRNA ligase [[Clostridium] aminophilum]MCR4628528.1 arginine--tRNA ligase [Clostridium sp.]SFR79370.1 arginyl-tRNA synthetase [[Clostridium] aminophilum]